MEDYEFKALDLSPILKDADELLPITNADGSFTYEAFTCEEAPENNYYNTSECHALGAEACDVNFGCAIETPEECLDLAQFSVCAATVGEFCTDMDSKNRDCVGASTAMRVAIGAFQNYTVPTSPCTEGAKRGVVEAAAADYQAAFTAWADAHNNASQVCTYGQNLKSSADDVRLALAPALVRCFSLTRGCYSVARVLVQLRCALPTGATRKKYPPVFFLFLRTQLKQVTRVTRVTWVKRVTRVR